jgi:hypothetical protein
MKPTYWIVLLSFCLTGCSEMRVIGSAAMRELRADAVAVNWTKTVTAAMDVAKPEAKVKSFSAFRKTQLANKTQTKGLWEKHGS